MNTMQSLLELGSLKLSMLRLLLVFLDFSAHEIAAMWMPQNLTDDKSTLV